MTELDADPWTDINFDDPDLQKLLDEPLELNKSLLRVDDHFTGFDNNVGDTWIYPNNLPFRCYQFNIAQAALYRNTLVVLPTGLGKTFIAAVVMYNLYRWYPTGKVIFMAPTRPLVAQQIEACQKIMPFPSEDTVELTGKLNKKTRTELWQSKRVFFATPQVVQSDIASAEQPEGGLSFPFALVKLVVVDEAHKAKGRYAYNEVLQSIWQRNRYFRVLALSATPGRTTEDVAQVVHNLFISHLEIRSDTSVDVSSYVHKRTMSTVVVSLSAEMEAIRDELLEIIDPYLRQLIEADVLSGSLTNISRNWLLYEQKRFRERSLRQRHPKQSMVTTNFSVCISLYHALDLLERHGTRVFLNNFEEDEEGRAKFVVSMDRRLRDLIERVRREVGHNPFEVSAHAMTNGEIAEIPADLDFGHPKFEKARSCLLEHFQKNSESRAIVFCEYRESVMLVYRLLLQHRPLLKPRCFVGQGGNTGFLRALTQKQQIQIMSDFRSGVSNILIATCIGEEGIDVGEVDLIVCFDISTTNPTRFVQRIGRTGRQRKGAVIMLATAGKEQAQLKEVLSNRDQTNKKLAHSTVVSAALYKHAPRMVPTEFNPRCLKTYIKPPSPPPPKAEPVSKRDKKLAVNKNKNAGSQDLRTFFKKAQPKAQELDAEDLEVFVDDSKSNNPPQPPGLNTQISIEKSLNKLNNYFGDLDLSNIAPATTQTQVNNAETTKDSTNAAGTAFSVDNFESKCEALRLEFKRDEKRLRKFNKFLESECSRSTEKAKPMTRAQLLEQLRSPDITRVTKRIILIMSVDFVRETCERMKALLAAEDNSEDDDDEEDDEEEECTINAEDQETRDNYQLLLDIYEGKEALEKFLEDMELKEFKRNCSLPDEVLLADDDNEEFMNKLDHVFKDVQELGFCNDNWDYINAEYKKTRYYKKLMADNDVEDKADEMMAESMVYETMQQSSEFFSTQIDNMFQHEDFNITDSKYYNQWEEPARSNVPYNSTPQRSEAAKSNRNSEDMIEESTISESKQQIDDNVNLVESVDCSNLSSKYCTKWDDFVKRGVQQNSTPLQSPAERHSAKQTKPRNIFSIYEENPKKPVADPKAIKPLSIGEGSEKTTYSKIEKVSISPKLGSSTLKENESTPENLQLSLTAISKEEVTSGINTLATTESKQNGTELSLDAQSVNAMLEDIDFDAFLEPFPEECIDAALPTVKASTTTSVSNEIALDPPTTIRNSPDIFENEMSPLRVDKLQTKLGLAGKLATMKPSNNMDKASVSRTPPKSLRPPEGLGKSTEKSPCIYDMYVKNMRRLISQRKLRMSATNANNSVKEDSGDETVIVRKRNPVSKRKVIESDSEEEAKPEKENEGILKRNNEADDTSSDEIQASQQKEYVPLQRPKRRRLLCSFIEEEPAVSGSDVSEDEAEFTLGHYVHDSVVVPNDEAEDDASTSQMKAMYLQSVRSPVNRRGAFKIPAFKVYNDHEQIYSQAIPVEKSQYVSDSFVVSEDDDVEEAEASSLCPLEQAERILKEKRRARRRYAKIAEVSKARTKNRQRIESSDEDFE